MSRADDDGPSTPLHVLFVCSRNRWRSPTAERLFHRHPHIAARSAGTSAQARHRINVADIRWADVIVVMEPKHKQRVAAEFGRLLTGKPMHVLDVPDEYGYMDPELVALLEQALPAILPLHAPDER